MQKSRARADRRAQRAARRRNQRLAVLAVAILLLAAVVYVIYTATNRQAETTSPGATTSPSGLVIEDLEVGAGEQADTGDTVTVHYTGTLQDGTKFDSSLDRGQPYTFTIGQGRVIAGWEEGIPGMKVGGKRKLTIPPELGYGAGGSPPVIPANATLIFEVELLEVQ